MRTLTNTTIIYRLWWGISPKGLPKSFRYHIWWGHSPIQQSYTGCGEASHQKDYPKALDIIFGEDTHQYSQHIPVLVMHLTKRTSHKLYISYLVRTLTNTASIYMFWWGISPKDYPKDLDVIFGEDTHHYSQHIFVVVMLVTKELLQNFRYNIWWL